MLEHIRFHPCLVSETAQSETGKLRFVAHFDFDCSDEGLMHEMSAKTVFVAFSVPTSVDHTVPPLRGGRPTLILTGTCLALYHTFCLRVCIYIYIFIYLFGWVHRSRLRMVG